jgi:flagellar biosynthesis protein
MSSTRGLITAAALRYESHSHAPAVVAKGGGLVAEEIIRRARLAGVPVHQSPELVSLLMQVDLDREIPPELYLAVAELLAWASTLEQPTPMHAGRPA